MMWVFCIILIIVAISVVILRSTWLVNRLWRAYGHTYDGLLDFWPYQNLMVLMLKRLDLRDGQRLLDLGCGTGNLIKSAISVHQIRATGVDISETMLEVAVRKLTKQIAAAEVELHQQDIVEYLKSLPPQTFDRIASVNVIYAINDRSELWSEMLRVLKLDGKIVITTSVRHGSLPIIREHFNHQPPPKWITIKLLGVFFIDAWIVLLGRMGSFSFVSEDILQKEVAGAGAMWNNPIRCYGGEVRGVNLLVDITKA